MSESCLKFLPQGCANCVLADGCPEKQLYDKGKADGIDECIKMVTDEKLCLELEKMKEQCSTYTATVDGVKREFM